MAKSYPLTSFELYLHFIIWTTHSLLALILSIYATRNKVGKWLDHWLEPSSFINGVRMDNSDIEWKLFQLSCPTTIFYLSLHSIVFKITSLSKSNKSFSESTRSSFLILFWLAFHIKWSSIRCVALVSAFTCISIILTLLTKRQWVWILALAFIAKISDLVKFSEDPTKYYREFNLYLYSTIKIVNICVYLTNNPKQQIDLTLLLKFLHYMLYPPYSMALIVLFEDFEKQMYAAEAESVEGTTHTNISTSIKRILRLSLSFLLLDALLHVCSVNALFNSPFTMLQSFNKYEIASIAYVAGQLFHMKYVLIFGLPSFFASIDGMDPPNGPICISRVSKYSQMWRYFDRGLHKFLRNQVYIPLISQQIWLVPSLLLRKLCSMLFVFTFVLIWHGFNSNYFWWVSLSAFELCIERVGTDIIWPSNLFQNGILPKLSAPNLIRLKALSMLTTVIPGIFGIFFFLGQAGIGHYIFSNLLVDGLVQILTLNIHFLNAGWVLAHLLLMGYSFNHVCLYLEHRLFLSKQKCDDLIK